jgi:hypothetical protein
MAHLTILCATRPEFLSVVRLCSMTPGIRSGFTPFFCDRRLRLRGSGGACEGLEVFFGMGFPEREDKPE